MHRLMEKQTEMFNEFMQVQTMSQHQWENEMLKKEHNHQHTMLHNFMLGMQAMQHRNF